MSSSRPFNNKVEDEFDAYATFHKVPIPIEILWKLAGEALQGLEWKEERDGYDQQPMLAEGEDVF